MAQRSSVGELLLTVLESQHRTEGTALNSKHAFRRSTGEEKSRPKACLLSAITFTSRPRNQPRSSFAEFAFNSISPIGDIKYRDRSSGQSDANLG